MTDHLRRLDALFAEKVLGLTAGKPCMGDFDGDDNLWWCDLCAAHGHNWGEAKVPHEFIPKPYTRSLDAAWEGATKKFPVIDFSYFRGSCHVEIEQPPGYESMADSSHPAEALVLACLRAVGCFEEELA